MHKSDSFAILLGIGATVIYDIIMHTSSKSLI